MFLGQQASQEWIRARIRQLDDNDPELARRLMNQFNSGELRVMISRAAFSGDTVTHDVIEKGIKEVGEFTFKP